MNLEFIFTSQFIFFCFLIILLFFLSLSFSIKNNLQIFLTLYFWNFSINNLLNLINFFNNNFLEYYSFLYFGLSIVLIFIFYKLFEKFNLPKIKTNSWITNFIFNLILLGFVISTLPNVFIDYLPNFLIASLFDFPARYFWGFAPIVLVILTLFLPKKITKKIKIEILN